MTTAQLINLIIDLICTLEFRLFAAILVSLIIGFIGCLRSSKVGGVAGLVSLALTFGVLEGLNYLLNLPLDGSLFALPSDYVIFWLKVGVAIYLLYLIGQVPVWVLLAKIYRNQSLRVK